ncbi:LIC10729 family protein [Leptospira ryugenii]|uniref:LIC10729 family protein n=1 Tax=Leptospira ryugenii TaxID=1917863 RepID=UPI001FCEBCFB|nr:hypothetical protein [Leptospira ryugenii]
MIIFKAQFLFDRHLGQVFPLKVKSVLISAIFFSSLLLAETWEAPKKIGSAIDFAWEEGLLPEDIATYPELRTWALYQSYELEPDSNFYSLENQVARMVPETGLRFFLEKENYTGGALYLYLDLTKFIPLKQAHAQNRRLAILLKGKVRKEIFWGKSKEFQNPVEIEVDSQDFIGSRLEIELIPSQNEVGRFWGIWDACLVKNRNR